MNREKSKIEIKKEFVLRTNQIEETFRDLSLEATLIQLIVDGGEKFFEEYQLTNKYLFSDNDNIGIFDTLKYLYRNKKKFTFQNIKAHTKIVHPYITEENLTKVIKDRFIDDSNDPETIIYTLNELFKKRELAMPLWEASYEMTEKLDKNSLEIINKLLNKIKKIQETDLNVSTEDIKSITDTILNDLECNKMKYNHTIFTEFALLDNTNFGIGRGEVVSVAACTSVGKTTFCINMAYNMAKKGNRIGIFSTEMQTRALVEKIIGIHSALDENGLQTPVYEISNLTIDKDKMNKLKKEVDLLPIFFDDTASSYTDINLYDKIKNFIIKNNIDVFILDHIYQVRDSGKTGGRTNVRFENMMNDIKSLALELNIPIILPIHVSKDKTRGKTLKLADIKDSSSVEQVSDVVIMLEEETYGDESKRVYRLEKCRRGKRYVSGIIDYNTITQKMLDNGELSEETKKLKKIESF